MSLLLLSTLRSSEQLVRRALALLCCLLSPQLLAESGPQWHGFLSQGVIKTSDNSFFGDSENTSWEFSSAALGLNWRLHPKLTVSGQALYRRAGKTSPDGIYTDYAFADLNLFESMDTQWGLRAGRVKNPYGLYSETRDIAAYRPSILLPESIYIDPFRDVFHSSDSISLYGHWYLGDHLLQLDLLTGKPIITEEAENEFFIPAGLKGELVNEDITIARITTESFGSRLKLGYTYTEIYTEFEPDPGTRQITVGPGVTQLVPLNGYPGHTTTYIHLFSLDANLERWQFTAELQNLTYDRYDSSPRGRQDQPTRGLYGAIAYRWPNGVRVYARRDIFYADKDDKDGSQFATTTGRPAHNRYAYDSTFGVSYSPNKNWHLALELHEVTGTAWLSWNENWLPDTEKDWSMVAAQIHYQF